MALLSWHYSRGINLLASLSWHYSPYIALLTLLSSHYSAGITLTALLPCPILQIIFFHHYSLDLIVFDLLSDLISWAREHVCLGSHADRG